MVELGEHVSVPETQQAIDNMMQVDFATVDQVREVISAYLAMDSLAPEKQHEFLLIMKQINNSRAQECGEYIAEQWKKIWDPLSSIFKDSEEEMRRRWMATEFPEILNTFISVYDEKHWVFQPELLPENIESPELRAQAEETVKLVRQDHVPTITRDVQVGFEAFSASIPKFMQDAIPGSMRQPFLQQSYFQIVRSVVESDLPTNLAFSFKPMVPVDSLKTAELRLFATSTLREVRKEHVEVIAQLVESQYQIMLDGMPPLVLEFITEDTKSAWLAANYYAIVALAISGSVAPDVPAHSTPQDVASRKRDLSAVSMCAYGLQQQLAESRKAEKGLAKARATGIEPRDMDKKARNAGRKARRVAAQNKGMMKQYVFW